MIIKRLTKAVSITGVAMLMMAANASALNITYSTNGVDTGFFTSMTNGIPNSPSLSMSDSSGATATLVFSPDVNKLENSPTNLDYGFFTLSCSGCTSNNNNTGTGATFGAFSFDIEIIDQTDGATGLFQGTSPGGTAYTDSSTITITWTTLGLGPGLSNALSGSFASTEFLINSTTGIVAPNSGTPPNLTGESTVQGSVTNAAPEPATSLLFGGGLAVVGFLGRKKLRRV